MLLIFKNSTCIFSQLILTKSGLIYLVHIFFIISWHKIKTIWWTKNIPYKCIRFNYITWQRIRMCFFYPSFNDNGIYFCHKLILLDVIYFGKFCVHLRLQTYNFPNQKYLFFRYIKNVVVHEFFANLNKILQFL